MLILKFVAEMIAAHQQQLQWRNAIEEQQRYSTFSLLQYILNVLFSEHNVRTQHILLYIPFF